MRKVGSFKEEIKAVGFVQYLQQSNITALIEEDSGEYAVWVHDEGHVKIAKKMFDESKEEGFKPPKVTERPPKPPPEAQKKSSMPKQIAYQAYVTKLLLTVCVFVFVFATVQKYSDKNSQHGLSGLPPIAKDLLIDYPRGDEIVDELINKYGLEKVKKNEMPEEAAPLIFEYAQNRPWVGIYNIILQPKSERAELWSGHFLTSVRKGQVWRLFTPAILHVALLHLLFNLLWLLILGKMVEFNMGRVRFVSFILITGIFSNLCQYMMTGPYFMGVSGVLSAIIGYIWVRKRIAPWEVYLVRKETIHFFMIFIFGFLGIQVVAFLLQKFTGFVLPITIANTGHISGLLIGMLIARTHILSRKVH